MADVEQSGILARPQMLGHDAFILDGHVIAGERRHAATAGAVPRVERQGLDIDLDKAVGCGVAHAISVVGGATADDGLGKTLDPPPPLSRNLRAFTANAAYTFGGPAAAERFPECRFGPRGPGA